MAGILAEIKPMLSPGPNSPNDKNSPSIIRARQMREYTYDDKSAHLLGEMVV